ncbi:MAG: hypothetical protein WCH43_09690 [Verrucomicrobiota bacterium]
MIRLTPIDSPAAIRYVLHQRQEGQHDEATDKDGGRRSNTVVTVCRQYKDATFSAGR